MALSKLVDVLDEVDIKVHYTYNNVNRVTMVSIEFNELKSLGYFGLEAVIQSQIKYIGRPSSELPTRTKKGIT